MIMKWMTIVKVMRSSILIRRLRHLRGGIQHFITHTDAGFFEQYKADQTLSGLWHYSFTEPSDLGRQRWLDNDYYGFISTLHIGTPGERYFVTGGGWNRYDGQHFGKVIWTRINGT